MQRMQSRAGSITEDPSALLKMDLGCLLQDGKLSLAPSEEETIKTAFNNFHELFCAFQDQEGPDHSVLFEHSKIQPLPPVSAKSHMHSTELYSYYMCNAFSFSYCSYL